MKQLILSLDNGKTFLEEVPVPRVQQGEVLIQTRASIVSTGTERMLMDFGKAGWIGKVRQQPEQVKQVLEKISTDGLAPTIKAVRSKLDAPVPLGYSQSGVVIAVGNEINDLKVGDRVASNGVHAEIVSVPRNLVAKVPDGVSDEAAAFTILGAIALQSIRLVAPTFGETVVVIGLGLIGQLTSRLLAASGCRVIGADLHKARLQKAGEAGTIILNDTSGDAVRAITGGHGADAVIITASTESDAAISLAADMCRKRGRIVLTGVTGMQLSREQFFRKELTFQVSTSYGPGRYEPGYEGRGLDYPIGYVRWTEGRNFDAVLQAMASGMLDVTSLITVRKPLSEFQALYDALRNPEELAGLITYTPEVDYATAISLSKTREAASGAGLAIIGAGAFTAGTLLPALASAGASVQTIVSRNGLSATALCRKFNIPVAGSDATAVFEDLSIGSVIITTRHNTHAALVIEALKNGKHVLVEKPLALTRGEVERVHEVYAHTKASLMVGFNRRFAPLAVRAKELISAAATPINIVMTVNAGSLPATHWLQDVAIGGGRILGEACHFIDLCAFFADSSIAAVCAAASKGAEGIPPENVSILLRFENGAAASVNYLSNGSKAYDKERVELYSAGRTVVIENWRTLHGYGFKKEIRIRKSQDKGHNALVASWIHSVKNGSFAPVAADTIFNSTLATIAVQESLTSDGWISL